MNFPYCRWRWFDPYAPYYLISDTGAVRSLPRPIKMHSTGNYRVTKGGILKGSLDDYGYVIVGLSKRGKMKAFKVHRLVAICYLPNPGDLPEVNHKDGNKQNNHVDNLEWVSTLDNALHAKITGLRPRGADFVSCKLSDENLTLVRLRLAMKDNQYKIADDFGISQTLVSLVNRGLRVRSDESLN